MIEINNETEKEWLSSFVKINNDQTQAIDFGNLIRSTDILQDTAFAYTEQDGYIYVAKEPLKTIKAALQFFTFLELLARKDLIFPYSPNVPQENGYLLKNLMDDEVTTMMNHESCKLLVNKYLQQLLQKYWGSIIVFRPELSDFVNNDFKTPEQLRFEVQMQHSEKALDDAREAYRGAKKQTSWFIAISVILGLASILIGIFK